MTQKEIYTGNISVSLVFVIAYFFNKSEPLIIVSISILFLTILSERTAQLLAIIFHKILSVLGYINSRILLSLFYLLILTPISLIKKGTDKKPNPHSNWKKHNEEKYNFEKLW